ncbi:MAG TPA: hypothetical protein VN703_00970 [Candidatus Sulfopaludibacter sp.]|nr:hypothetical protein [Candidatus Sulfopaludibacter sp.]
MNGIVYGDAKIHLKKHKRYLPQKIKEIRPNITKHNLEVNELEKTINDFINSSYFFYPYDPIFPYHFTPHITTH